MFVRRPVCKGWLERLYIQANPESAELSSTLRNSGIHGALASFAQYYFLMVDPLRLECPMERAQGGGLGKNYCKSSCVSPKSSPQHDLFAIATCNQESMFTSEHQIDIPYVDLLTWTFGNQVYNQDRSVSRSAEPLK